MDSFDGVLFLHAFPLDHTMWDSHVETVGRAFRAVAPDFPGFGSRPAGPSSLEEFAEVALREADRAGLRRFVPVGVSMGGYVAFRLVARWPERVAGLVLADTRAAADSPETRERRTALIDRIRGAGTGFLADSLLPGLLGQTTRESRPDVVARVRSMIAAARPDAIERAVAALRDRPDSTDLLPAIRVPALVLVGNEDALVPAVEAGRMAAAIRGSRYAEIEAAGHLAALESPDEFMRELMAFLREL
jgi:3-oxoadipate enol-lactonase